MAKRSGKSAKDVVKEPESEHRGGGSGDGQQPESPGELTPQEGLLHSAGLYSALMVWRQKAPATCADLCDAAARLMDRLSAQDRVHWVVGVSPHLADAPEAGTVLPRRGRKGAWGKFPSSQGDVFLQIAGANYSDVAPVLRLASTIMAPWAWVDEETRGGQLNDGREPFGFRDPVEAPSREEIIQRVTVREGPFAGGSWLLYLRFVQDTERFSTLSEEAQQEVIGRTRDGEELSDPPNNAHVTMAKSYGDEQNFIRRGFPYRAHGDEGLAFIAAGTNTDRFAQALDLMLGDKPGASDPLLPFAWPVGGGVYLAPANAEQLRELGRTHECRKPLLETRPLTADGEGVEVPPIASPGGYPGKSVDGKTTAASESSPEGESERRADALPPAEASTGAPLPGGDHAIEDYPAATGPRVVPMNMSSQLNEYLFRMISLGAIEGALGEMDMPEELQEIFGVIHHLVAGGEVKLELVRQGNPDIVMQLNRLLADGMDEANEINERAGYYVTAAA